MDDLNQLEQCPIFQSVSASRIGEIISKVHFRVRRVAREDLIALAGDRCTDLLIILEGSVRGEMNDNNGHSLKIEDVKAPRTLATAFLFGKNDCFPVTVIANCNSRLMAIPRKEFLKLMQNEEQVLTNYLNIISSRAQFLSQRIRFLTLKTIRMKIASYLLSLDDVKTGIVHLSLTQQELARYFGVSRPALARELAQLEKEGFIQIHRKEIRISNKEQLKALIL